MHPQPRGGMRTRHRARGLLRGLLLRFLCGNLSGGGGGKIHGPSPPSALGPRRRRRLPLPAALQQAVGADAAQVPAVHRQQHHGAGERLVAEISQLLARHHACNTRRWSASGPPPPLLSRSRSRSRSLPALPGLRRHLRAALPGSAPWGWRGRAACWEL